MSSSNSALVASESLRCISPNLLPGFLMLKDASAFSCVARLHGYHEMANKVLELLSTSCHLVELPFNQNMERAKDGTVLNSLSTPLRHFTSSACVSIQLAFAQRCLQMAASGTASLVGMLLEGNLAMSCIIAGGRLHGRILRELLGVGFDGKRQDTHNSDRAFDYHFSPLEVLKYTEALSDDTWSHFRDHVVCDLAQPWNYTLPNVLCLVDDVQTATSDPVLFIVIGCGKAFGLLKIDNMVVHFDSHQRSLSGDVGDTPSCIAGISKSAVDFLPHFLVGNAYLEDDLYDVYKAQAVQRRGSSSQEKDVPPQPQSAEAMTLCEMYEAYVDSAVAKPAVRDPLTWRKGSVARILRTPASQEIPRQRSSSQEKDAPPQPQSAEALTVGEIHEANVGSAVAKLATVHDPALSSCRGSFAQVTTARPFRKQRKKTKQICAVCEVAKPSTKHEIWGPRRMCIVCASDTKRHMTESDAALQAMAQASSLKRRASLVAKPIYGMLKVEAAKPFRAKGRHLTLFRPTGNDARDLGLYLGALARVRLAIQKVLPKCSALEAWDAELRRIEDIFELN